MMDPAFGADAVHLWHIDCDAPVNGGRVAEVLDEGELERAGRVPGEPDGRRFMVAHAAVRSILARYRGTRPELVYFRRGQQGKPELADPGPDNVTFNLAHSNGIALLAVAAGRRVGVDVEKVRDDLPFMEIAGSYFSGGEAATLRTLSPEERREMFFIIWTRREALVKALGAGLSLPPESFDVSRAGGGSHCLSAMDTPWSLVDVLPAPGFYGAVASEGRKIKLKLLTWDGLV